MVSISDFSLGECMLFISHVDRLVPIIITQR